MAHTNITDGLERREFLKLGVSGGALVASGGIGRALKGLSSTALKNPAVATTGKVTMIYVPDVLPHLIPQIAKSTGIYADHGLDVTLIASDQPLTPVLSGSANVGFPAPAVLAQAIGKGQNVKALVQVFEHNLDTLLVRQSLASKLQNKGKFPEILRELKGMRIGESEAGDGLDQDLRYMIKLAGMSASDFSIVPTSGGQAEVDALITGEVDVVIADHPQVDQVVADGDGVIILDLAKGEGPAGMQYSYVVAAAESSWVNANPSTAKSFVAAIVDTETWIRTPSNEAKLKPIIATLLPGLTAPVLAKVYSDLVVSAYPQISAADVSKISAFAKLTGLISAPLTYDTFVATGLGLPSS